MPAIDHVFALSDARALFKYAGNYIAPPEARLFAGAKIRAMNELRASAHEARLSMVADLDSMLAGLDSLRWADPNHIGFLLELDPVGAPPRPERSPQQRDRLKAAQQAEG